MHDAIYDGDNLIKNPQSVPQDLTTSPSPKVEFNHTVGSAQAEDRMLKQLFQVRNIAGTYCMVKFL
jgi:hypothetical protein